MTRIETRIPAAEAQALLAQILAELGIRRTLAALLRLAIATNRAPPRPNHHLRPAPLNDHLRRDIGLAPLPEPPPVEPQQFMLR